MKFNINEYVRVKLTDHGRKILREQAAKLILEMPCLKEANLIPEEDAKGWSEFQMWDLFSRFEGHIHNGAKPCFETTIEIITP